jgi:hypothetical protein
VIKSRIGAAVEAPAKPRKTTLDGEDIARLKREILAECRALLRERLARGKER